MAVDEPKLVSLKKPKARITRRKNKLIFPNAASMLNSEANFPNFDLQALPRPASRTQCTEPRLTRSCAGSGSQVSVSRTSSLARETALRIKCQQEGYELLEVSYCYVNGQKKKRIKKRRITNFSNLVPLPQSRSFVMSGQGLSPKSEINENYEREYQIEV